MQESNTETISGDKIQNLDQSRQSWWKAEPSYWAKQPEYWTKQSLTLLVIVWHYVEFEICTFPYNEIMGQGR